MKLIFKIARAEIRNLFFSPVAWFLGVAFLVQCAYLYVTATAGVARWQEAMLENSPEFSGFNHSLTAAIFLKKDGIFDNAMNNLYLFLPLLTMGLISREINSGTIKLLYSSPIKTRHIVFGKYLAIMLYNIVLLGILGIFMTAGLLSIKHVDTGLVLSALLAFYLLVCAYSAIGIFMSSLTTYQIVSAVSTFLTIFVLSRIGGLWQQYDIVRDLTYFLSLNGRTIKMVEGLITTNDVLYFLLIITMFLSFTLFRLRSTMESKAWYISTLRYIGVLALVLLLGYFTSRPGAIGYWDTTRGDINTIHPNTQQVIQDFDPEEPLEVTLYANLLGEGYHRGGAPQTRNEYTWKFWEKYLRFKPDIKFNYVYYYDIMDGDSTYYKRFPNKTLEEIAAIQADAISGKLAWFKKPEEIRKEIDLQPEHMRLVMQLKYKGRTTFLRTFNDPMFWPDEQNVSAAFKRLQQAKMPQVLYTTGNLERSIYKTGEREFFVHSTDISKRIALVNQGFDVDSINLDIQDIPDGIDALVIADPKTAFSPLKIEKLRTYIAGGGNAYFLGEPGKQRILNPILADLGVRLASGTLIEVTADEMPHMIRPVMTPEALVISDQFFNRRNLLKKEISVEPIHVLMPGSAAVEQVDSANAFEWLTIFKTDSLRNTFNKVGKLVTDSVPPAFNPEGGDTRQSGFATLVGLSRPVGQKQQRVLVAGDADFMSTLRGGGSGISVSLFSWLDENRFPIYTPRMLPLDRLLTTSVAAVKVQYYLFVWILPAVILLLASVMLIRRKRK